MCISLGATGCFQVQVGLGFFCPTRALRESIKIIARRRASASGESTKKEVYYIKAEGGGGPGSGSHSLLLSKIAAHVFVVRPRDDVHCPAGRRLFRAGHMALPMALARLLARPPPLCSSESASAPQTPPKQQHLIWNAAAQQLENNALPRRASFPSTIVARCSFCRRFMTRLLICTRQNSGRRRVVGRHFGCSRPECASLRAFFLHIKSLKGSATHVSCVIRIQQV